MPVAPNLMKVIHSDVERPLVAARLSGGTLSFYNVPVDGDSSVLLGSVSAPAGLTAEHIRGSVMVSDGGTPLIHGKNDGVSPAQLFSITPSAVVEDDWITISANDVADPSGLAESMVFVSGGVAHQWIQAKDVHPGTPFTKLRLELHPLSASGRGTAGPSVLYEDNDGWDYEQQGVAGAGFYCQFQHDGVHPTLADQYDNSSGGVPSTSFTRTSDVPIESIATLVACIYQSGYDSGRSIQAGGGNTLYEHRESPNGFVLANQISGPLSDETSGGSMSLGQEVYTWWTQPSSGSPALEWFDVASSFPAASSGSTTPSTFDGEPDMVWAWDATAVPEEAS